jgi:hypothetical protein
VDAARDQVRVEHGPTRCPFCHESVAPASDDWVACSQCLGRHHAACWEEGAACAGCGHTGRLTAGEAHGTSPPAFTPVEQTDDVASARRKVASHFDRKSTNEWWWLEGIVGPLTFGLLPLMLNERRLRQRDVAVAGKAAELPDDLEPDLAQRIVEGRRRALSSRARGLFFGGATLAAALTLLWAIVGLNTLNHSSYPYDDWNGYYAARKTFELGLIWGWIALTSTAAAYLHTAREVVRAHELRRLFEALVLRAAPPAEADKLLKTAAERWTLRRIVDTILTLVAFVPVVGLLAWPFLCLRVGGALSLHDQNEELLDQRVPPARVHAKRAEVGGP